MPFSAVSLTAGSAIRIRTEQPYAGPACLNTNLCCLKSEIRHDLLHVLYVGLVKNRGLTQISLPLGGLLGQDVALISFEPLGLLHFPVENARPAVLLFRAFPSCLYRPVPDYNKREHGHRYMQFPARISCGRRDPPAFRVCDCSGRGLIS